MKKLKNLFSKINVPMVAFLALTVKVLVFGATVPEVVVYAFSTVLYGFKMFMIRINMNEQTRKHVERRDEALKKEIEDVKNFVSKMNLSRGKSGYSDYRF